MSLREYASSATKMKSSRIVKEVNDVTPKLSFHRPQKSEISSRPQAQSVQEGAKVRGVMDLRKKDEDEVILLSSDRI